MTIWAAFSNFEEKKRSLEVGKWADLVIYDKDLMKAKVKF
jgi:predicted amidohydrolase YtcJ